MSFCLLMKIDWLAVNWPNLCYSASIFNTDILCSHKFPGMQAVLFQILWSDFFASRRVTKENLAKFNMFLWIQTVFKSSKHTNMNSAGSSIEIFWWSLNLVEWTFLNSKAFTNAKYSKTTAIGKNRDSFCPLKRSCLQNHFFVLSKIHCKLANVFQTRLGAASDL